MSDTALVFYLLAKDGMSPVLAGASGAWTKFSLAVGASALLAGGEMVHMAADFQQGMTRLVTGAGEVKSNMGVVSAGILNLAGSVGESTKDLAAGMYLVESAGYHGAAGLDVLRIAAQGAKVGNADMATVADAVTTALNAYHMGADGAAAATNALIAAEGQGKTNLEALSGSLSTVAPIASLAHVSLNELLGAMATMTAQGTPAADAATYLKQTIGQLSGPTAKARAEMKALGLDATQVSMNLGKNGLASTLTMLTDAITAKMGPAGTVLIEQLRKTTGNATEFQKILANLPPTQQTFIGALATMVGGTKSMQAALELTGPNMKTFIDNTDIINGKVKSGGKTIEGWADVQQNFNQKMAEAKGTVEALGIRIGTALLPKAQELLDTTMKLVEWFTKHKEVAKDLAIGIGSLAGAMLLYKGYLIATNVIEGIAAVAKNAMGFAMVFITAATKGYTAAMVVSAEATKGATIAQWLLNAAQYASPVGLIIIAVIALAVGIYILWTRSAGFRNFFIGMWDHIWSFLKMVGAWFAGPFAGFFVNAWHAIANAGLWLWHNVLDPIWQGIRAGVAMVTNFIRSLINLWLFIGHQVIDPIWKNIIRPVMIGMGESALWLWRTVFVPVGAALGAIFGAIGDAAQWLWKNAIGPAFHGIAEAATWVWGWLVKAFDAIIDKARSIALTFRSIFSAIGGFISNAFETAVGAVRGAINHLLGLVNSAIGFINRNVVDVLDKVPGVTFGHVPTLPTLGTGGHVTTAGLAVVGDQGAEVVRLGAGDTVYPNGAGPGGGAVRVVFDVTGADEDLKRLIRKMTRVEGGTGPNSVQLAFGK